MGNRARRDLARQAAGVLGAVFQALAGVFFVLNLSSDPVADEAGSTLIDPAAYAFFVWAVILLWCLAYAAYQALPSRRSDALLRRVGWPLAGAFFLNGLWEVASPLGLLGAAQVLIAGILAFLAAAYFGLAHPERGTAGGAARWLVAAPVGVYFGWITAANAVSLASLASRSGLVGGGGLGGAALGSALLIVGSVAAALVVRAGKAGVPQGYLAYGATFLWALLGIVANQYQASAFTAAVAVACAALVAWSMFGGGRGRRFGAPVAQG